MQYAGEPPRFVVAFSVMASVMPLVAWLYDAWIFNLLLVVLSGAATLTFLVALRFTATEELMLTSPVA